MAMADSADVHSCSPYPDTAVPSGAVGEDSHENLYGGSLAVDSVRILHGLPFISISRGLVFPQITTPMLPSSVALYMLGMLMAFNRKINFFAFLLVLHWSVIAISKIGIFKIPEDALLAAACIPSMVIFVLHALKAGDQQHKPSYTVVRMLVIAVALVLAGCMVAA